MKLCLNINGSLMCYFVKTGFGPFNNVLVHTGLETLSRRSVR